MVIIVGNRKWSDNVFENAKTNGLFMQLSDGLGTCEWYMVR